tara:strand:+ start:197 stop:436 length:240 start_codon:yes stop_codon:yes gene_type:complete
MTEEQKEENQEVKQAPAQPKEATRDHVMARLNHLTQLPIRCVNIVYIPETGELMLNHTQGMPRHEIVGLMEAVRDETKK